MTIALPTGVPRELRDTNAGGLSGPGCRRPGFRERRQIFVALRGAVSSDLVASFFGAASGFGGAERDSVLRAPRSTSPVPRQAAVGKALRGGRVRPWFWCLSLVQLPLHIYPRET